MGDRAMLIPTRQRPFCAPPFPPSIQTLSQYLGVPEGWVKLGPIIDVTPAVLDRLGRSLGFLRLIK